MSGLDRDPGQTGEGLGSLDAVATNKGASRASFLLERLIEHAQSRIANCALKRRGHLDTLTSAPPQLADSPDRYPVKPSSISAVPSSRRVGARGPSIPSR